MKSFLFILPAMAFVAAAPVQAVLLDWSTLTWTPGSLSHSYDIDSSNPGNDITITVSGNTSTLGNDGLTGNPTPDISTFKEGGTSPADASLAMLVDFTSRNNSITVTVDFNYANGVTATSLNIFDIDVGSSTGGGNFTYVDQIRNIWGRQLDGTAAAATITNGVSTVLAGAGTNQTVTGTATVPDTGSSSDNGNAYLDFGNATINRLSFTYGSGRNVPSNPSAQAISLFDINYTKKPVPESGVVWGAMGIVIAALLTTLFQRRPFRPGHSPVSQTA